MSKIIILFFIIYSYSISSTIFTIPQTIEYNKNKALLGKKLFKDKRLSIDNTISCESCHNLEAGGVDGLVFSIGVDGKKGGMNAPTVFNSTFNFRQFWDGRAKDLEEQALGPIENPVEMAHPGKELVKKLKDTEYVDDFDKVYEDGITLKNIANAIAEFEKTLITPNSRFDKFLNGDENALSADEKKGYELFKNKGCISCHHGRNIGGNHYNKFGTVIDVENESQGRFEVTNNEDDKYYFKVPTLRNIEITAPYFHDGRTFDLKEAVEIMSLVQLGRPINENEIKYIVAFLRTLTGEVKIIE